MDLESEPPATDTKAEDKAEAGLCMGGLDTSPYLSGPMPSPTTMIMPSPPGPDVNQRVGGYLTPSSTTSPHQGMEKESSSPLTVPYTTAANFPLRPAYGQTDSFASLPDHLLPPIHPNMVNVRPSSLENQMVFVAPNGSGGMFQTVGTAEERNGFHGSAFVPAKCLKLEKHSMGTSGIPPIGLQSHYHSNGSFLNSPPTTAIPTTPPSSSSSGGNIRSSPPIGIKEECPTEGDVTESPDPAADPNPGNSTPEAEARPSSTLPEEGRILRKNKRKGPFDGQCPLCGVTVRFQELASHFEQEVEKLTKISRNIKRAGKEETSLNRTYQRVKSNRQNRLTAKAAKGKKKKPDDTTCPVCNERLTGTPDELTTHVEQCLKRREECDSEDEPVDVEGDDTFEEYEWAGQKRIRVTSLLQGGFSGSGFQIGKHGSDDDDEDLNVDGDDSSTYGQPQYTEADVIPCSTDKPIEDKERQELRRALLINSPCQQRILESSKWSTNSGEGDSNLEEADVPTSLGSEQIEVGSDQLITSLKEKIKDLEEQQKGGGDRIKCLICMEPYTKPVVSVCCWHVHCEECWLRTLGVKKLCPQCNMITSPSDLRRIYL